MLVFSSLPAASRAAALGSSQQRLVLRKDASKPASRVSTQAIKEIFMPALSSTMTDGKVVSWLKAEGDPVTKGEPILVVESDKADMDVESFNKGVLAAITCPEGERAPVGSPIGFTAETDEEVAEAKRRAAALVGGNGAPAAAAPAAPSPPPAAAAPPPPPSPPAAAAAAAVPVAAAPIAAAPAPAPVGRSDGRIIATPYAKQLAKELKVDLKVVGGTGPAGRITASDVERAAGRAPVAAAPVAAHAAAAPAPAAAAAPAAAPAAPAAAAAGPKPTTVNELRGTTVPFTTLQHAVNRNMLASLAVPEFRVAYQVYTDRLDDLYKKLKPKGVTMTGLLAKACGIALAQHPLLNASVTPDGQGITHGSNVSIAMAVTMADGGLITPVLKDCDVIDIYQLSRNWADLVKRARSKQLSPNEYSGANFTISNMGMYGVSTFDAILPPGTAGILAVAASKPTVVATEDGMIGVKKVMTVKMTCDHRLVYGAQASEFLQTLKQVIENPDQLVM